MMMLRVRVTPIASGAEHDRGQEKAEYRLDHVAGPRGDGEGCRAESEVVGERRRAEAGLRTAQHGTQQERAEDAAKELANDVADCLTDAHGAGGEHGGGHAGIKVRPRQGAVGESEGHDGQTMGERDRGDTGQAGAVTDNGRGTGADKY
jgi:hypothetical protein